MDGLFSLFKQLKITIPFKKFKYFTAFLIHQCYVQWPHVTVFSIKLALFSDFLSVGSIYSNSLFCHKYALLSKLNIFSMEAFNHAGPVHV